MGSSPEHTYNPRQVVPHGNTFPHQPARIICNPQRVPTFPPYYTKQTIRVLTDNIECMFYINWQGGACSHSLCTAALKLWNWCIIHNTAITAAYLPGRQKKIADTLSRQFSQEHEWELNNEITQHIFHMWGSPHVDLFATLLNKKCPKILLMSRTRVMIPRGRFSYQMERSSSICIPTNTVNLQNNTQNTNWQGQHNTHSPDMAWTDMVPLPNIHGNLYTVHSPSPTESSFSGRWSSLPSRLGEISPEGVVSSWLHHDELTCLE